MDITVQELEEMIKAGSEGAVVNAMDISVETALQLCVLDQDGGGTISLDEFVEGCLKLRGNAKATDIHMLMHASRTNCHKLNTLFQYFGTSRKTSTQISVSRSKGAADNFQFSPAAQAWEFGFDVEV